MTAVLIPASTSVATRRPLLGPNWFASVMGTGIVATAAVTLPIHLPGGAELAVAFWLLACGLLVALVVVTARQWLVRPEEARAHLSDPVLAHFYGAPAMALMTVGAGALLVGRPLIGTPAAAAVGLTLWVIGTSIGLWTTLTIPRRLRDTYRGTAFGGWLMPVVPPMVSAATGAVVAPHLPADLRPAMTATCWTLFVVALLASLPLIILIVRRVFAGQLGPAATVPTLFIVVGPLGQSVTAAHALAPDSRLAMVYGLPVLALAAVWLVVATALTVRTTRTGLPFAMTWWSFTFPIGTVVTGASGLAEATGSIVLRDLAVALFVVLLAAWVTVAVRTLRSLQTA
ncbi:TDT family transporter [Aeromicrobium sp. UC242_57]|uniref:TDT family transporter n=1 Tax=Aeromicrobium sp. UC242_57 TaxID=3374624 RepID=UPI00379A436A